MRFTEHLIDKDDFTVPNMLRIVAWLVQISLYAVLMGFAAFGLLSYLANGPTIPNASTVMNVNILETSINLSIGFVLIGEGMRLIWEHRP